MYFRRYVERNKPVSMPLNSLRRNLSSVMFLAIDFCFALNETSKKKLSFLVESKKRETEQDGTKKNTSLHITIDT
jgi:hypothetical protein